MSRAPWAEQTAGRMQEQRHGRSCRQVRGHLSVEATGSTDVNYRWRLPAQEALCHRAGRKSITQRARMGADCLGASRRKELLDCNTLVYQSNSCMCHFPAVVQRIPPLHWLTADERQPSSLLLHTLLLPPSGSSAAPYATLADRLMATKGVMYPRLLHSYLCIVVLYHLYAQACVRSEQDLLPQPAAAYLLCLITLLQPAYGQDGTWLHRPGHRLDPVPLE